jgi:pimeloyl-ACP methyl ester carboxylesterase
MLLAHRDFGGVGKPPLVILHGMLGSSRNWQTAGQDLAADFHALAPDLRNHGASGHDEEMTYEAMTSDVLSWMDTQALGRVALLGHSMGGKVAMLLACRHPERVERLIVVDIAPKRYFWPERRAEFAAMSDIDLATLASRAEAEKRIEGRVPGWAQRKFLLTNLDRGEDGRWRWLIPLAALTRALPELEKNPLAPDHRFSGRALWVAGEKSHYVEPDDREAILRHFPAAQIEIMPGSGHNPHMEARRDFMALVSTRFSGTTAKNPQAPPTR